MKIGRLSKKLLAMVLAIVSIMLISPLNAFVGSAEEPEESVGHALVLKSESLSVKIKKTIQLTATVTNVETQPEIIWSSSDESIATVDSNGVVKGIAVGKAIIRAKATVDGETIHGEFSISVIKSGNILKDFLVNRQVLSYQYSYIDDYYYTNDKDAWQYNFGFGKIY
ncbi:MAG: Ig domain-containing protein, partial [Clostridia bacterium]|nr:Ig domain-containing protein [Clostridia bacterium]